MTLKSVEGFYPHPVCPSMPPTPCPHLEFVFQEQSYSSQHSGWSLAWDHVRGDIDDPCGIIADFYGVIADPCGIVAIPEVICCGDVDRCATR